MLQGIGKGGGAAMNAVNTPVATAGASGPTGGLSQEKDAKEASTAAKFGEVLGNIQAKYGAKADKPREIKKVLGKDDFLRIMITQMKNQDPTSPFKPEQMAQEMAQFTSVEQLQNINQNLSKMSAGNQPLERMAMTNLIGKSVTIDRDRFTHTEGSTDALGFQLPREAKSVKAVVVAESGEVILEKDLGPQKVGENTFTWDGLKANTLPAKAGNYILRVEAKDENDSSIPITGQSQSRVIGISFEGAEPVFLVGDARSQQKITMKNIIRIEDQGSAVANGGQQAAAFSQKSQAPSLISFQKGIGSGTIDPGMLDPSAAEALSRANQATAAAQTAPKQPQIAAQEKPTGFPNGLQDQESEIHLDSVKNTQPRGGENK